VRRFMVAAMVGALVAALCWAGSVGSAQAATTSSLSGRLALFWPLPADSPRNAPCDPGALCGAGSLTDFGAATITIESDDFSDSPDCALAVTRVETIHLLDGSGDLVLDSSGIICFPGRSGDAADQGSFGNPSKWSFTSTVDGASSTGVFAGATGSGTEAFSFAGAVGRWVLTGSVTTG
jgi:hypothetical protein